MRLDEVLLDVLALDAVGNLSVSVLEERLVGVDPFLQHSCVLHAN